MHERAGSHSGNAGASAASSATDRQAYHVALEHADHNASVEYIVLVLSSSLHESLQTCLPTREDIRITLNSVAALSDTTTAHTQTL